MRFGHFDDERLEYIIDRPDTPVPWINYLGSEDFVGLISNTAAGYCFYRDARLRRLLRFRYNQVPADVGARFLYLRDNTDGAYWSPTGQPVRAGLDEYSCRHGLGYTAITSARSGIRVEASFCVPLGQTFELWQLTVENTRTSPTDLSLFAGVEFCLWDALDDATNFQRNYSIGEVEVEGAVIYHKTEYRERRDHFAYFACSESPAGFDTQREAFLGPQRGWEAPLAVERGACAGSIAHGWSPIAMQHVPVTLGPGASHTVVFALGYAENPPGAKFDPPDSQVLDKRRIRPLLDRYLQADEARSALQALGADWRQLRGALQVQTPDVHTDRMVNTWNPYQCMVTLNLSRSASLFESGIGRGIGFRDSNQDLLGLVHMVPGRARRRLLDLATTQLPDGGAYHQYQPLTRRGNNEIGANFNDDPLWLVLSSAAYIKETGDLSILDEKVEYDNQPGTAAPLFDHLQRSLEYTLARLGPHGLPLIGRADWNDCLNLNCFSDTPGASFQTVVNKDGKVAESTVIAALFILAAGELADLAEARGLADEAERRRTQAESMRAAVDRHGWDGDWFLRAYDDFGHKLGSHACQEGQIFIEPQGLCVLAGIGLDDGRARRALDAVAERLATPHGIILQQPAFSRYYLHLGEISSYPPGYKENAGIFCHANPWIMIAEARLGRADKAFDYYTRLNPSVRESISDVHRCEPYVYAQMIAGRDAVDHGTAKNSWLTGTAAWNYVAITQWILGIRPEIGGLRLEPVIPASWPGFSAVRRYRGATYHIAVERKGPGSAVRLTVDGRPLDGTLIPPAARGRSDVRVHAVLS